MDTRKVGLYIKERIKEKGITQDQLAEKLSISSSAVSQVLNGKNMFDIVNLQALSKLLDEPIDKILNSGEEPETYLEVLSKKNSSDYIKEDPNKERINDIDHKGFNLIHYLIKHENIELIKLYENEILSKEKNNLHLQTILIKNNQIEMLKKTNYQYFYNNKNKNISYDKGLDLINFQKEVISKIDEVELNYLKAIMLSKNNEIYEMTLLFYLTGSEFSNYSNIVNYAIIFDLDYILRYDLENRINCYKKNNELNNDTYRMFSGLFEKLMKISILNKSMKCIDYCYSLLTEYKLETYFDSLVRTEDLKFINNFIEVYKNKVEKLYQDSYIKNKFDTAKLLWYFIDKNNIELIGFISDYSTEDALNKGMEYTKPDQIEIMKLLLNKGAFFMERDSNGSYFKLENVSAMIKYLLNKIS